MLQTVDYIVYSYLKFNFIKILEKNLVLEIHKFIIIINFLFLGH